MFFNIFVNDTKGLNCIPQQVAYYTKLVRVADALQGRAAVQRYFRNLEEWDSRNPRKFSKQNVEKSFLEKTRMGSKWNRSQQYSLVAVEANCGLGCTCKNGASRLRSSFPALRFWGCGPTSKSQQWTGGSVVKDHQGGWFWSAWCTRLWELVVLSGEKKAEGGSTWLAI